MLDKIWQQIHQSGRQNLTEFQASRVMTSYGILMAKNRLATNISEARDAANELGYPLALKILSPDILHKTEAGCVAVGIVDEQGVESVFQKIINNAREHKQDAVIDGILVQEMAPQGLELILGVKKDPQFEHVIMFGLGGIYVEVFKDVALRLLPINKQDAGEMVEETNIGQIIKGIRGTEYDLDFLISVLVKLSKLIEENQQIEQIDLNPFFLYEKGKGGKGVDALITLSPPGKGDGPLSQA